MKTLKKMMLFVALAICWQVGFAQEKYDQLFKSNSGQYGTIFLKVSEIEKAEFSLSVEIKWVGKDMQPVENPTAAIAITQNNLKLSSDFVKCTNCTNSTPFIIKKNAQLKFKILPGFTGTALTFETQFQYLENFANATNLEDFMFQLPEKISKTIFVPADKILVDEQGPEIIVLSPQLSDMSRGFLKVEDPSFRMNGIVKDQSAIYAIYVNGEKATLNGNEFTFASTLIEGDQTIIVKALDEHMNVTEKRYGVHYRNLNSFASDDNNSAIEENASDGNYYALIVGNNEYTEINQLDKPIRDAQKLYDAITSNYTFAPQNVILLKNATRSQMIDAFDKLANKLTPSDNLLIFYAGHGWWDESRKIGYWLPVNAKMNSTADWLRNSTVQGYIAAINTKHTLLVADACFSGGIFKTRSAFNNASKGIKKLYELPSRKAMTSGTLKEVPDESVFLHYLVKRLNENSKDFISAEELFASFREAVLNNSPNIPQYGTIRDAGDEGGDFIFVKKK